MKHNRAVVRFSNLEGEIMYFSFRFSARPPHSGKGRALKTPQPPYNDGPEVWSERGVDGCPSSCCLHTLYCIVNLKGGQYSSRDFSPIAQTTTTYYVALSICVC